MVVRSTGRNLEVFGAKVRTAEKHWKGSFMATVTDLQAVVTGGLSRHDDHPGPL